VQNVGVNLTPAEIDFANTCLDRSKERLDEQCNDLTAGQWSFREADAWSILMIVEHVYAVEAGAMKRIVTAPPSADSKAERDALVLKWVSDRSRKVTAPEVVTPHGRTSNPAELLAKFAQVRARSLKWLNDPAVEHRAHAMFHPFLGVLDGYQWLLFFAQHLDRHLAQIAETKAHPRFP
jgi:hypothetical protein